MEQVLEASPRGAEEHHHHEHDVAVAVITPAGIYPSEDEFRRVPQTEAVETTLRAAAEKLHLTNTSDWVARVHDREIDVRRTFREQHLNEIVELHWHKHEGGGGA